MAAPLRSDLKSTVVIDCGSGYSKMGYSGNLEPSYVIPSTVLCAPEVTKTDYLYDLDFLMGESSKPGSSYTPVTPMSHGKVTDWNVMERVWQRAIYSHMRCDPEEHAFMLTESPLNTPENREYAAEIFFETFNVPYLYIAVQAVLSLAAASCADTADGNLPDLGSITGVAVESGDGVTSVVPVAYGYTIGSAIRTIPMAGKDVTRYIYQMLKDRGEKVPPEMAMEVAKQIKENHCYVAGKEMVKEFRKFDKDPAKMFKEFTTTNSRTGTSVTVDVGYEQFLGPEMFFNPEIINPKYTKGLPQLIDEAVLACPVDVRRPMYRNIVLSGGNTLFKKLASRLQKSIDARVQERLELNRMKLGAHLRGGPPKKLDINVNKFGGRIQQFGVWLGGSLLAEQDNFLAYCHSKARYDEEGPRIARSNAAY